MGLGHNLADRRGLRRPGGDRSSAPSDRGDFYVALMADGSLKCWENHEDIILWILLVLVSIALSLIVAVIITGIYLIKYLVRRI